MAETFKSYSKANDTTTLVFVFLDGFIPDYEKVLSPEEFSSRYPHIDVQNVREVEVYVTVPSKEFENPALQYFVPNSVEFFQSKDMSLAEDATDEDADLFDAKTTWFKALRVSI